MRKIPGIIIILGFLLLCQLTSLLTAPTTSITTETKNLANNLYKPLNLPTATLVTLPKLQKPTEVYTQRYLVSAKVKIHLDKLILVAAKAAESPRYNDYKFKKDLQVRFFELIGKVQDEKLQLELDRLRKDFLISISLMDQKRVEIAYRNLLILRDKIY
ncbi:MAG TPA: hypothetical protein VFF49_06605 [Thermodesulfobacteriota bacterium]|nr:hypothetical protein [Thermodesulfobacteriota bacterium]